jgi:hypothetical protein
VLHAQDHAENIRVERLGILLRALVSDRADLAFGASVVDRDIQTAKPRNGLVDECANVTLLTDVGVDELGLPPNERSSLASAWPASSRRPATTTFAPCLAKARAAARPMPVSAPVIKTTDLFILRLLLTD